MKVISVLSAAKIKSDAISADGSHRYRHCSLKHIVVARNVIRKSIARGYDRASSDGKHRLAVCIV